MCSVTLPQTQTRTLYLRQSANVNQVCSSLSVTRNVSLWHLEEYGTGYAIALKIGLVGDSLHYITFLDIKYKIILLLVCRSIIRDA